MTPIALHRHLQRVWHSPGGWRALTAVNHNVLGRRFIATALVFFFVGGMLHRLTYLRQFGSQCLTLIQRLGADLTGMVDAHQAGNMLGLLFVQLGFGLYDGR